MARMFRLPDYKALAALVRTTHVRVAGAVAPAAKVKRVQARSAIEEIMAIDLALSKLPPAVRQYRYLPDRKFRADFAWPDRMVALEVDGAVHRIKGSFNKSFERAYLLQLAGWTVLHVGREQIISGQALSWIENIYRSISKKSS